MPLGAAIANEPRPGRVGFKQFHDAGPPAIWPSYEKTAESGKNRAVLAWHRGLPKL